MKYVTTIDNQSYEIEILTKNEITADGERYTVDFQPVVGPPVVSLIIDDQSYEAYVNPTEAGLEVLLRGQRYLVNVEDERQRLLREVSGTKAIRRAEIQLKSPMPGLIVAWTESSPIRSCPGRSCWPSSSPCCGSPSREPISPRACWAPPSAGWRT